MERFKTKEQAIEIVKNKLYLTDNDLFLSWLIQIGYFEAPAAKSHHGNYIGGLFDHSYRVAEMLDKYTNQLSLVWERPNSPWIVGLLHDICKVDDYVCQTDSENEFQINPERITSGHGDKSILMLAGHYQLTEEEAMCIQFHMGAFTEKDQWQYYSRAVKKDPKVLYTHTADMYASQYLGI